MKGSRKGEVPPQMKAWLGLENENWKPAYPFDNPAVIKEVRECLLKEQRGLCVYCGSRLVTSKPGETFHIEHFRPQSSHPKRATDYTNLFLSCGTKDRQGQPSPTCGNARKNWFHDTDHVEPGYPHCISRFKFKLNGQVIPALLGDAAAQNMINNLNLNHRELVTERENVFKMIDSGTMEAEDYYDNDSGSAESYAHIVYQYLKLTLP